MVMTPEPLIPAIESLAGAKGPDRIARVIYLSPQGAPLTQPKLHELAGGPPILLVCGRYEGIDQRVLDLAVDEEISLGDFVVSGGELPAMVLIEGLVRLLPGVLGNPESIETAADLPRSRGARGAAIRQSCLDRAMASRACPCQDARTSARSCRSGRGGCFLESRYGWVGWVGWESEDPGEWQKRSGRADRRRQLRCDSAEMGRPFQVSVRQGALVRVGQSEGRTRRIGIGRKCAGYPEQDA
jgi:hypothetical protein